MVADGCMSSLMSDKLSVSPSILKVRLAPRIMRNIYFTVLLLIHFYLLGWIPGRVLRLFDRFVAFYSVHYLYVQLQAMFLKKCM